MLRVLLFILPLGLDTLGVSISLGIKGFSSQHSRGGKRSLPPWLRSALLFSLAETLMPLAGLVIGYATSLLISSIMHFVGPLLLIGVGLWELIGEAREVLEKRNTQKQLPPRQPAPTSDPSEQKLVWSRQLLLALSVSLDELAVGFSLGVVTNSLAGGRTISPFILCLLIGLQAFLMTFIGLSLGRFLQTAIKPLQQWSEWLSALLLISLGIWLLTLGD